MLLDAFRVAGNACVPSAGMEAAAAGAAGEWSRYLLSSSSPRAVAW